MDLPKLKNQNLFVQAFTHRSFLNEVKSKKAERTESNERLEFLGDSILSFVVSNYLFKNYPSFEEGTLTNLRSLLVNTKNLASIANDLKFGDYLKLSKGEEESKGRQNQSLLADSFEAYIGALYLDQGLSAVSSFITQAVLIKAQSLVEKKTLKDPKSLLQEYVQAQKQNSPIYKVLEEKGPAHAKIFKVGVYVGDSLLGKGEGRSKQEAEESAAIEALNFIAKNKTEVENTSK